MDEKLENGYLLLAEPFMADEHFTRAVVLICDRHAGGSMGFIMNKPMKAFMHDILDDFPDKDLKLHYGGPVSHDTIHFIHNRGDIIKNSFRVDDDIYWGGDLEQVKECLRNQKLTNKNIRFFVGYSSWRLKQLEEEIADHSWVISQMDSVRLFTMAEENLWAQAMNAKGGTFEIISDISEFSNLN